MEKKFEKKWNFGLGPYQYEKTTDVKTGQVSEQSSMEFFSFKVGIFGWGVEVNLSIDLPEDTADYKTRRNERNNSYCGCGTDY